MGNLGNDTLAQYRMPMGPTDNHKGMASPMSGDHLVIPPLAGLDKGATAKATLVAGDTPAARVSPVGDTPASKATPAADAAAHKTTPHVDAAAHKTTPHGDAAAHKGRPGAEAQAANPALSGEKGDKGKATPGAAAGKEHTVQHDDNLWKIAEQSLGGKGHASASKVWNQVQNIVQANKQEHPELLKNPNMIHDGMKLHVPHPDHTQGRPGDNANRPAAGQPEAHPHAGHPHAGQDHHHHRRNRHHHGHAPAGGDTAPASKPAAGNPADSGAGQPKPDKPAEATPNPAGRHDSAPIAGDNGRFAHAIESLGKGLANIASNVANALGTVGDCAHGPRLAFGKLGFHMPPAVATEQGRMVRNSGLFDEVPANQVRPGDYGVRDWSPAVTRAHGGVNKGDAFIVSAVGPHGQLYGANDHHFAVPPDGGRYRNLKFYRPNAEFIKRYGEVQT
jgi:nucleoid-associated protein YgaU